MRYYVYKLYFKNGCTYIGKHTEKHADDGYITSSAYYKCHKDLLEKREIILEVNDLETLDIMETICILADIADNPSNVNRNKGAWMYPSRFDRGYSGPANGMYGKKLKDTMTEEHWAAMNKKRRETLKRKRQEKWGDFMSKHNGMNPREWKCYATKQYNQKLREINKQIREAHKLAKQQARANKKHFWQYDPTTLEETYLPYLKEGYIKGRLPHDLWPEERKQSYREKHSFNALGRMDPLKYEEHCHKCAESQRGRQAYNNGTINRYFMQGEEIPEGYVKGFIFNRSEKYKETRKECAKKAHEKRKRKCQE